MLHFDKFDQSRPVKLIKFKLNKDKVTQLQIVPTIIIIAKQTKAISITSLPIPAYLISPTIVKIVVIN